MRGCGITPFFCVDKFYIHVDLFLSSTYKCNFLGADNKQ